MADRYYTIKQAAQILGVTQLTLRNWDKRGILTAYRNPVNNYRLYRYADIADFLAAVKESGPRASGGQRLRIRMEDDAPPPDLGDAESSDPATDGSPDKPLAPDDATDAALSQEYDPELLASFPERIIDDERRSEGAV